MHDDIIHTLIDWIESNLDKTLSIDEVAAKSGYSKWHLQRMFRSVTKQTLGGFIRERRLTLAAEALCKTHRPVFDIAMQYGFDSQQTFSRVFRRQFSQTPTAYRHTMRRQALTRGGWNFDCSEYAANGYPRSGDRSRADLSTSPSPSPAAPGESVPRTTATGTSRRPAV